MFAGVIIVFPVTGQCRREINYGVYLDGMALLFWPPFNDKRDAKPEPRLLTVCWPLAAIPARARVRPSVERVRLARLVPDACPAPEIKTCNFVVVNVRRTIDVMSCAGSCHNVCRSHVRNCFPRRDAGRCVPNYTRRRRRRRPVLLRVKNASET